MIQEVISATKLIDFEGVSKTYQLGNQRIPALKGIDLTIESGDFIAIAGPSGSGKSTLLNLLALIDTPTSGDIRYNNIDVSTLSDDERTRYRNKEIGIVFQNYNLIPVLDALENVAFALQVQGVPTKECLKRAEKILREVGLGTHLHHRPANLSGGQKQRVAIARALVTNPSVVIADEPTAALDSKTGMEILELMKELNYTKNTTFIFSTHDNRIIDSVHHVVYIEDGFLMNRY
ncbi:MAG: ABC transporter ATP-binding protein [Arcicella sp.]|jgi:putative ABC transport system ATP-binding protein|nr:ABC transporter ATP-binding protein [Arcicella sp.]